MWLSLRGCPVKYWKVYLWYLFLTVLYFSCQPFYLNRAVDKMGAVREEVQENNLEGMAASVSLLYPGCTKGQEGSVALGAGVARKQSSWEEAGDELQVTGYFAGITDVVFCIISAKFVSCRQGEVRGSTHLMITGDFLHLDRKDSLRWWSNSLFFPLLIFNFLLLTLVLNCM